MRGLRKASLVAGCALVWISWGGFASAQSDDDFFPQVFGYDDHDDSNGPMINVPDQRGCAKWCFRDDSPCDPPRYKRADNRCRNVD